MVTCQAMITSPAGAAWPATSWTTPRVSRAIASSSTISNWDAVVPRSRCERMFVSLPHRNESPENPLEDGPRQVAPDVSIFDIDEAAVERPPRRRARDAGRRLRDDAPADDADRAAARSPGYVEGNLGRDSLDARHPRSAGGRARRRCLNRLLARAWTRLTRGVRHPDVHRPRRASLRQRAGPARGLEREAHAGSRAPHRQWWADHAD